MSARLDTNFVKTKYINPPIAILPLIFSNCFSFLNKFYLAIRQNLKGLENKKVLITSKLRKIIEKFIEILFQTLIKFKAKPFSSQYKASRSQQS